MAETRHEADLINEDRRKQAEMMQERLERLGVTSRVAHFTGDSSYPTEYRLSYGTIQAVGPTFDLALTEFIEKLLTVDKAEAYRAMETSLQLLTGNILNLRTEVLAVKAFLSTADGRTVELFKESEQDQEYEDSRKYMEHYYLGGE